MQKKWKNYKKCYNELAKSKKIRTFAKNKGLLTKKKDQKSKKKELC